VQCEETWSPLLAPVNAEAKGYWTTFGRPDGSKQWAYQGYAMYTYAPEGPGVVTGHDTFDVTVNHSVENLVATNLGMYWRVTSP
jgi:predicted lipoprotein with Yx(FWY)xxD motif